MSAPAKDARKSRRFFVDVEATITAAGGSQTKARARDLSRSGICLISGVAIDRGKELKLSLVLAFGNDAFSEPLALDARVVWCTPIAESFQIGAMFEDVTEEQDGFLQVFLQCLDGTLAPGGVDSADDEDTAPLPLSPEDKDDPFRN